MGLAVYNSIILDLHFPGICYRKLLTPPVVPQVSAGQSIEPDHFTAQEAGDQVGVARNITLEDLAEIMPEVATSLQNILEYEGDVEADMFMTFQISVGEYGKIKTVDLKPGGEDIPVTGENRWVAIFPTVSPCFTESWCKVATVDNSKSVCNHREEFVRLYLEYILNTAVMDRFRAFYLGFHSVCASNALIMLRPEEVTDQTATGFSIVTRWRSSCAGLQLWTWPS